MCFICGGNHENKNCLHPVSLQRCSRCFKMIISNEPHLCIEADAVKNFRIDPFAVEPTNAFKIRLKNADMYFFNGEEGRFEEFFTTHYVVNPATAGVFTVADTGTHKILSYDSVKYVQFSFYIALLGEPTIQLRAIVTSDGLMLMRCEMEMENNNGKLAIPNRYKLSTAFVLGLSPRSENLELLVKSNNLATKSARWEGGRSWVIAEDLDGGYLERVENQNNPQPVSMVCLNCGAKHSIQACTMPFFTKHCTGCLLVSLDGNEHENPCQYTNKISLIRKDILSNNALTLYQMGYSNSDVKAYYLDNGQFVPVVTRTKLVSPPAEAIITFQNIDNQARQFIVFKQASFQRCSVLIAVLDSTKVWRLRLRLVVSSCHGVLAFKLTRTVATLNGKIVVPKNFQNNTVAFFGFEATEGRDDFYIDISVHANGNGQMSATRFDGYTSHIGYNVLEDRVVFGNELEGNQLQKFNRKLYKEEPKPLSTFKEQRIVPIAQRQRHNDDNNSDWTDSSSDG